MMKHTYATPAQVGTNVKSVTHSWFGADALKWRFTRSGCGTAVGSSFVVFTRFDRRTPLIPRFGTGARFGDSFGLGREALLMGTGARGKS